MLLHLPNIGKVFFLLKQQCIPLYSTERNIVDITSMICLICPVHVISLTASIHYDEYDIFISYM